MSYKLSILICTIPERYWQFKKLVNHLKGLIKMANASESVEIVYNDKPKGTLTIGGKRNILLNESLGEYVCFIDDDDQVSNDYITEILKAIELNPDCIGFKINCNMQGKYESAASSIKYDWKENIDGYKYVRSIYHKTPVKREIALKAMFPDKSFGEDYEYSMRLKPMLKKEVFIEKELYIYNFKYENPKTKYGLNS
jgi:glycosyltransferase involved in cell wall biosynthesis